MVMCHSKLIPGDIKRAMEHTEDIDVPVILYKVSYPIVPVEEDTYVARGRRLTLAHLGKGNEVLRPLEDALDSASGDLRIIGGDVLEDVLEPALGLRSPRYLCHERMRRAMSSFEITRFASESASPRPTMT